VPLKRSVALGEVYDKSEGKIFQGKIQPAGILLNGNAIIYFKFKLQLKLRNRDNTPIIVNFHTYLGKKCIKLHLKFRKNKSYHGKRTAHWYIALLPCSNHLSSVPSTSLCSEFRNRLFSKLSFQSQQ